MTTIHSEADVETTIDLNPFEETDDPNVKAHLVNPPMNTHIWMPGMETTEIVEAARFLGLEIVALCGYRWVPKHNPDYFDVCDACMKIASDIMRSEGE